MPSGRSRNIERSDHEAEGAGSGPRCAHRRDCRSVKGQYRGRYSPWVGKTLYGKEPSGQIGRSFVIRAIAYRLQEKAFGGLKPSTRRLLARVAEETAAGSSPKGPSVRKAEPGTILIRAWQGKTHRVTVLGDGVSFKGKRYRSLSWRSRVKSPVVDGQGPRFFGLRLPELEKSTMERSMA